MSKGVRMFPVKEWDKLDMKVVRFSVKIILSPFYLVDIVLYKLSEWAESITNTIDRLSDEAGWLYLELKRRVRKVKHLIKKVSK